MVTSQEVLLLLLRVLGRDGSGYLREHRQSIPTTRDDVSNLSRQFLPAIEDLQRDLGASQAVVNLSVSLFVLFQGTVPILWSAISEIYGRKIVYVIAYAIFTASQLACALSKNQAVFLAFRIIGACGSSAGLTIGEHATAQSLGTMLTCVLQAEARLPTYMTRTREGHALGYTISFRYLDRLSAHSSVVF